MARASRRRHAHRYEGRHRRQPRPGRTLRPDYLRHLDRRPPACFGLERRREAHESVGAPGAMVDCVSEWTAVAGGPTVSRSDSVTHPIAFYKRREYDRAAAGSGTAAMLRAPHAWIGRARRA